MAASRTKKNRISKRQRIDCFRAALGDLLKGARKYQHNKPVKKDEE